MYDLLIKNGRVIDPAQKLDAVMDVVINGERIAKVAADIPSGEARTLIDASGKIVTPGLIDVHNHVYNHILDIGADPDIAGVNQGVTTVVDCGSSGYATFGGFPAYVIPAARTTIYCLLHIASFGLSATPELKTWEEIDIEESAKVIKANPGLIRGIKLRLMGNCVVEDGVRVFQKCKDLAQQFDFPVMVHFGDFTDKTPLDLTQRILPLMEKGDIITHVYTARRGSLMQADGSFPGLKEAAARGVILDVANGRFNFTYKVARKALEQGILPTTISTDVVLPSTTSLVYGLWVSMSTFLELGMTLPQVIERTTINPARVLGLEDQIGSLKPGMKADVSILKLEDDRRQLTDVDGEVIQSRQMLKPQLTIKNGCPLTIKLIAEPAHLD